MQLVQRHVASGRHLLGLGMALLTALMWGALPVILKVLLSDIDPYTLTWCRFVAALCIVGPLAARRGELRPLLELRTGARMLLIACTLCMTGNFALYLAGLRAVPPSAAQIVMQLSPVFVLLGGLIIFREPFARVQSLGVIGLFVGMALFFNQRYEELFSGMSSRYAHGLLTIALSSFLWSTFSLTQKQLLSYASGRALLTASYSTGIAVLVPFIDLNRLTHFSPSHYALFAVSVALTLCSYLTFAEALRHLEASRTGVVVALTPLLTVAMAALAALFTDQVETEPLNALALLGALLVVAGSTATSLGKRST